LQALAPGDHVLAHIDAYYGTSRFNPRNFLRWGLESIHRHEAISPRSGNLCAAKTKLAWMETPSNPLLKIVDVAASPRSFMTAGAICVCDNTWAPVLQRPLDLGADLILHSTTKYFGGHCDVAGGIIVAKNDNEFSSNVHRVQYAGGAVPSPFDCWLILRGMRTLPWRMRAHSENALKVANFLTQHRKVEHVHYPGLRAHSGHNIAKRQMSMFGGMPFFRSRRRPRGSDECRREKQRSLFGPQVWAAWESLIEHRASIEGPGTTSPEGLLRLSIGLENADDLMKISIKRFESKERPSPVRRRRLNFSCASVAGEDRQRPCTSSTRSKKAAPKKAVAPTAIATSIAHNFFQKAQTLPSIQPTVIGRPANQREQHTSHANFSKAGEHPARFQFPCVPPHQPVEQKKIERLRRGLSKTRAAMSPAKAERKKPVEKQIQADCKETHVHWRLAFVDRIKCRRQHFQRGVGDETDGVKIAAPRGLPRHRSGENAVLVNHADDRRCEHGQSNRRGDGEQKRKPHPACENGAKLVHVPTAALLTTSGR